MAVITDHGPSMTPLKSWDSAVQVKAERATIRAAAAACGVPELRPARTRLEDGVAVQVDGVDPDRSLYLEAYTRQGELQPAQMKKVARGILRLSLIRSRNPDAPRGVVFAIQEAYGSLRGWVRSAAHRHMVELLVVDISEQMRRAILAAQERQFRVATRWTEYCDE